MSIIRKFCLHTEHVLVQRLIRAECVIALLSVGRCSIPIHVPLLDGVYAARETTSEVNTMPTTPRSSTICDEENSFGPIGCRNGQIVRFPHIYKDRPIALVSSTTLKVKQSKWRNK